MPDTHLACRDCGQIHRAGGELLRRGALLCRRCGACCGAPAVGAPRRHRAPLPHRGDPASFSPTPFRCSRSSAAGDQPQRRHRDAVRRRSFRDGGAISAVGGLVAMIAIAIPALDIVLTVGDPRLADAGGQAPRRRPAHRRGLALAIAAAPVEHARRVCARRRRRLYPARPIGRGRGRGRRLCARRVCAGQVVIEQTLGRYRVWNVCRRPGEIFARARGALDAVSRLRSGGRAAPWRTGRRRHARAAARGWSRAGLEASPSPPRLTPPALSSICRRTSSGADDHPFRPQRDLHDPWRRARPGARPGCGRWRCWCWPPRSSCRC